MIRRTLSVTNVNLPASTITRNVPLHCRMLLVEPLRGAKRSPLRLTTAVTDPKTEKIDRTNNVAVIESTYGKGKIIYIPFDISWSFFRYGHEYLGRIMELALREVASEPSPVEVTAPTIVQAHGPHTGESSGGASPQRHLVLRPLAGRGGESLYLRREVIPIHDITVTFRDKAFRRFTLVPGRVPLNPTPSAEGSSVRVSISRCSLHGSR